MDGLIAVHSVVVLQDRQQVTFEPGSVLPPVPDAEGERLLAAGAVRAGERKPGRKPKAAPPAGGAGDPPPGGDGEAPPPGGDADPPAP